MILILTQKGDMITTVLGKKIYLSCALFPSSSATIDAANQEPAQDVPGTEKADDTMEDMIWRVFPARGEKSVYTSSIYTCPLSLSTAKLASHL